MSTRRISTPDDLGTAVRAARVAARLTQAQVAVSAGVSREWLIGLERGTRPRAELSKVLAVLAALDLPLTLGHEGDPQAPAEQRESPHSGVPMTTAEVTRRAIELSRRPPAPSAASAIAAAPAPGASALVALAETLSASAIDQRLAEQIASSLPTTDFSALLPDIDFSALLPEIDYSALLPQTDMSSLMPQLSPALTSFLRELDRPGDTAPDAAGPRDEAGDAHEHTAVDAAESTDEHPEQEDPR